MIELKDISVINKIMSNAEIEIFRQTGKKVVLEFKRTRQRGEQDNTLVRLGESIAQYYGCTWADVQSKNRKFPIVFARQAFCYIARRIYRYSSVEIAKEINKDHSTVLSACNTIAGFKKLNTIDWEPIAKLTEMIKGITNNKNEKN